jgi:ABC-type branched-subunit amino acid transport system substrate-binding protein
LFKTRWLLFFTAIILLVLLVPACGGGDEETTSTPTSTSIATATPTNTSTSNATPTPTTTPTATPSSTQPVKIGAINSWSGPAAISGVSLCDPVIKLIEKQVKDQGGILGGREVNMVRFDNRGSVAEAVAGANKLMTDDKVSVLTIGGISGAEMEAVAQFAEKNKILFIGLGAIDNAEGKSFQLSGTVGYKELVGSAVNLAKKVIKPATVAFLVTINKTLEGLVLKQSMSNTYHWVPLT